MKYSTLVTKAEKNQTHHFNQEDYTTQMKLQPTVQ